MNATIIVRTTGNQTSITIRRNRAFKITHCATSDLNRTLRAWIISLSNAGYNVTVED